MALKRQSRLWIVWDYRVFFLTKFTYILNIIQILLLYKIFHIFKREDSGELFYIISKSTIIWEIV